MAEEKVGELTQAQLMAGLSALLDQKLSKLATKDDLLKLASKVQALEEENKILKEEVTILKRQEQLIKDKVVDLESRSRRNNLIFRGLTVPENTTDYCFVVRKFCTEVLGSRDSLWINRAHPLGRNRSIIIAHLPNDVDIQYIMSRTRTLKNTGYIVHRDFPQEIRDKRAQLVKVRAEVERVTGRRKMPLVHDHLTVEGCRFTWDDDKGKLRAGPLDGGERLREVTGRDFTEFLAKLQHGIQDHGQETATAPAPTISETQRGDTSKH